MPYWPIPMTLAALLLLCGIRWGGWFAPLVVLLTYIAMRGVMSYVSAPFVEVASCTLWLCCAAILCYKGAWVTGFFFALSGATYPALLIIGFRMEYMGLSPIIAAIFGLLALVGIGGGIYGLASGDNSSDYNSGPVGIFPHYTLGMAPRSLRD